MTPIIPYVHIPNYQFGPFAVQVFGLSVALAVIIGASLARRRAEEMKLDFDLFIDSFFWVIPGGFILSHVISTILYYPERIVKDPLTLLYFWEGISSFGGFLGGLLVSYLYFKWKKVPVYPYMEAQAYGLIPGFLIGRAGCAIAHDHPGMWLPAKLNTGMELAATHVKVDGKWVAKVISMPGWDSNAFLLYVAIFILAAGLIASLVSEKPLLSKIPLWTMALTGVTFVLIYPMLPSLIRSFGIPFPWRISSDWLPHASTTYFNLQDLEPGLERKALAELPLLLAPYFDTSTLQPWFFAKVPYEVTAPPMIVWKDFSYTATLLPDLQKVYHIRTRLAYDLGLIEFCYYVIFFTMLTTLMKQKHRTVGFVLSMWFISYAPIRFAMDLLRTGELRYDNGLTPGNYMAILTFALGVLIYARRPDEKAGEYVSEAYLKEEERRAKRKEKEETQEAKEES